MKVLGYLGQIAKRVSERFGDRQALFLRDIAQSARTQQQGNGSYKTVALNLKPKPGAWGGGNQFVAALARYLAERGHDVVFKLTENVDILLLVEGRGERYSSEFSVSDIKMFSNGHPGALVVHRVNECDQRKGTSDVDTALSETNRVAHRTIFISRWLRDYHHWSVKEQYVITNSCDERVFYPGSAWDGSTPFRLVTHHWAPNWNKGFRTYLALDEAIASGALPGVTFTVVGQWPKECVWHSARLIKPLYGMPLADELRQHHAYITASLWEPCGMHHVEGAACGLPIAYHRDGGGIVEMCSRYGVEYGNDVVSAIEQLRSKYFELRSAVLRHRRSLSAERMCQAYARVLGIE